MFQVFRRWGAFALCFALAVLVGACSDAGAPGETASSSSQTPSRTARSGASPGNQADSGPLVLYIWEDYIGRDTLANFTAETGIAVREVDYEDEEQALGALQSGAEMDLLVTSESTAREMYAARMLEPLDDATAAAMPNLANLDPDAIRARTRDGQPYYVPYLNGTTGIMVNTRLIPEPGESWALLWDPRYAGRLAMLNNPFEVVAAASKLLGHGVNPQGRDELEQVRAKLLEQRPLLAGYLDPVTLIDKMASEELWAAQIYSGDAMVAAEANPDIAYLVPAEGVALWSDVLVVPRRSERKAQAWALVNYLHRPEVMAAIASEMWYDPPSQAARELMDPEVLAAPEVFPPAEVLQHSEFYDDLGSGESVRQRMAIWSDLLGQAVDVGN